MSRNKKTTKSPMELMVDFLEKNPISVSGKTHPLNLEESDRKWDELILNNSPNGARKLKKQWKTFLYEWKSKTKKKARLNIKAISQTGGGGYMCKDLNDIENGLITVFGWVHIIGFPGAPEEVDPDLGEDIDHDEILEGLPETATSTTEVQNLYDCSNIEIILNDEMLESNIPNQPASESLPLPKKKFNGNVKTKPKKKVISSSSKLGKSAELYSQSTEQMALAVSKMATAISNLAEAISKIAECLKYFKKYQPYQLSVLIYK